MEPVSPTSPAPPARQPLFLGPGGYRVGVTITSAIVALVFGGLWLVVAIDALGGGEAGLRLLVMSVLGLGLPLLTWFGLSALNRRARRRVDFDTIEAIGPDAICLLHSFTGARAQVPQAEVTGWVIVLAPPLRAGEMGSCWLEVRCRQGRVLTSEAHATPDRLQRALSSLGVQARQERAAPGVVSPLVSPAAR